MIIVEWDDQHQDGTYWQREKRVPSGQNNINNSLYFKSCRQKIKYTKKGEDLFCLILI